MLRFLDAAIALGASPSLSRPPESYQGPCIRGAGDATLLLVTLLRRAAPVLQWVLAAGVLAAAVVIGTVIVRERRAVTDASAGSANAAVEGPTPTSVPAGAVSLPVLLFDDEKGIRLGDTAMYIAALLGRGAEVGRYEVDTAAGGKRLTRFYEYRDRRFVLVFTLADSPTDPPVTAIYLQQ